MASKDDKHMSNRVESDTVAPNANALITDLKQMIEEARSAVAVAVNAGLTLLYWRVGKRIRGDVLVNNRAEYGKEIVATLS